MPQWSACASDYMCAAAVCSASRETRIESARECVCRRGGGTGSTDSTSPYYLLWDTQTRLWLGEMV